MTLIKCTEKVNLKHCRNRNCECKNTNLQHSGNYIIATREYTNQYTSFKTSGEAETSRVRELDSSICNGIYQIKLLNGRWCWQIPKPWSRASPLRGHVPWIFLPARVSLYTNVLWKKGGWGGELAVGVGDQITVKEESDAGMVTALCEEG